MKPTILDIVLLVIGAIAFFMGYLLQLGLIFVSTGIIWILLPKLSQKAVKLLVRILFIAAGISLVVAWLLLLVSDILPASRCEASKR